MQAIKGKITTYGQDGKWLKNDTFDYYQWIPIKDLDGNKYARIVFIKLDRKTGKYVAVYHLDAINSSEMFFVRDIKFTWGK